MDLESNESTADGYGGEHAAAVTVADTTSDNEDVMIIDEDIDVEEGEIHEGTGIHTVLLAAVVCAVTVLG